MIAFRPDWRLITGEAFAQEVISKIDLEWRDEFQRLWVRTLLDLIVDTAPLRNLPPLTVKPVAKLGWRINSLLYAFFPSVDDTALELCQRANRRYEVMAIVPEGYRNLFTGAIEAACKRRPPSVMSVPNFTQWRFVWATCDCHCGRDQIIQDFARRFNLRVRQAKDEPMRQLVLEVPE